MAGLKVAALSLVVILVYRTDFIYCDGNITTPKPTAHETQTPITILTNRTTAPPTTPSPPITSTTKALSATTPTKNTQAMTSTPSITFTNLSFTGSSTSLNTTTGIPTTASNPASIAKSEETIHLVIIAVCFSFIVLILLIIIAGLLWTLRHHLAYRIMKNKGPGEEAYKLSQQGSEVRSHTSDNQRYVNSDSRVGNQQDYSGLDTHGASRESPQEESYLTISSQEKTSPTGKSRTQGLGKSEEDSEDIYINVSTSSSKKKGI